MNPQNTDLDVHDMVRQLTERHWHREPYPPALKGEPVGHYGTDVPALVAQLVGATPEGSGEMSGSSPKSRPAARIEALDTLMLIDGEAGEWIDMLGGVIPSDPVDPVTLRTIPELGTVLRLRRLHGLYPSTKNCDLPKHSKDDVEGWCCDRGRLEHAVSRWWYQARIITGWDTTPWRPWNSCPVCEVKGGLRVKLQGAFCVECRSVWDASAIGLLADHIRAENSDLEIAPASLDEAGERTEDCA